MKKVFIIAFLFFFISCKGKIDFHQKYEKKENERKEKKEIAGSRKEEMDPLLKAMKLLTEYNKDPSNEELKIKVCEAFSELAEVAIKKGNDEIAKKYKEIASICEEGGEINTEPERAGYLEEEISPLKMSLSNFDVLISGISKATQAEKVLLVLDEGYMEISGELSISLENKIKVVLYTDKEFYDTTGFPPWIRGAYDGKIHLPLANANPDSELFKKVIKHELTHAILHEATKGRCPTWLHEGLAQYFEGGTTLNKEELYNNLKKGKIPSINSPSFLLLEKEKSILLYQLTYLAVEFLKDRGSIGSISNFIKKMGEGEDIEEAFYQSFLFPYKDLTERIKEYLKNNL